MRKTSTLVCAVLAGTLGFSSIASARDWRGGHDDDRGRRFEQRQERRAEREFRQDRREDRAFRQGWRAGSQQPHYGYQQPRSIAPQPVYRDHGPRFRRGGTLPWEYRNHGYHVNDWRGHRGLYAPPHGHQWMNVNGEFLLVALATGLIANAILNSH